MAAALILNFVSMKTSLKIKSGVITTIFSKGDLYRANSPRPQVRIYSTRVDSTEEESFQVIFKYMCSDMSNERSITGRLFSLYLLVRHLLMLENFKNFE